MTPVLSEMMARTRSAFGTPVVFAAAGSFAAGHREHLSEPPADRRRSRRCTGLTESDD